MPIYHGLSELNKAEININGFFLYRVYIGDICVWQKYKKAAEKYYNFLTISDARGIAPTGYRVATLTDFQDLITYCGGEIAAGGELKALNTWETPNTAATNSKGFTALPVGTRNTAGEFLNQLLQTTFWIDNR